MSQLIDVKFVANPKVKDQQAQLALVSNKQYLLA
jgi:hypothetical protein